MLRLEGLVADEGFGTALLFSPEGVVVGAPFADGRVYEVPIDDSIPVTEADVVLDGRELGAPTLGATLAGNFASFAVGAPLAGKVLSRSGEVLLEGSPGLGLAVSAGTDRWVAAHATGWVATDGSSATTVARPTSVLDEGEVLVGFAFGEAVHSGGLVREGIDEAGFALVRWDADQDGDRDLVVGAPGAGEVRVYDEEGSLVQALGDGSGRFGAALAVADHDGDGVEDLVVGAPTAGEEMEGAVVLVDGATGKERDRWTGLGAGDELGTSVAVIRGHVAAGAPGAAGQPGAVYLFGD
jgi:hypothetical protein